MDKRTRRNKFNVEWRFADDVWKALASGKPIPPVPLYQVYDVYEDGREVLVKELPIDPMKVTFGGVEYFGAGTA